MIGRRPLLAALPWLAAAARAQEGLPERRLLFPQDHGAHPDLRTEWWYITGDAQAGGRRFGFQVTFFRSRVAATQQMQSRFAAKQLLFAHAALTDVQGQRLWHDQRIAREGFGIAQADTADARLRLRDWSLVRDGQGWHARIPAGDFALELRFAPTQAVLLQGRQGLSRKGPEPAQASYYYSLPQLAASGRLLLRGQAFEVKGRAWLDHEWSQALLAPQAVGWDWIGMNLDDGSALTAFQLRRRDGTALWDGGSFRSANGALYSAAPGETQFAAQRRWTSPASNATYPVEWIVRTPADFYRVRALVDNQELDSRASTGAIYWEGLSELIDSNGRTVGSGYLEMTGYASRLRL
jgi:predicted secreted hydrolase